MNTLFDISIPKPCHEDWNAMTPDEKGRFCSVCTKGVVDFTNKTNQEIQDYFVQNQGQKICGRFKNNQLSKVTIPIPKSVLQENRPFHRAFLLSLFVVMGSALFSCKNHNDHFVTGEPVVVEDTIKSSTENLLPTKDTVEKNLTLGKVDMKRYDSLVKAGVKMPPLPPPPPVKQVKFVKPKHKTKSIKPNESEVTPQVLGMVLVTPAVDSAKIERK